MKQLVEFIVKSLVVKTEAVAVHEKNTENGLVLELSVDKEDLGRVIGRQGKTIKAIRQLVTASATKSKQKVALVVQE